MIKKIKSKFKLSEKRLFYLTAIFTFLNFILDFVGESERRMLWKFLVLSFSWYMVMKKTAEYEYMIENNCRKAIIDKKSSISVLYFVLSLFIVTIIIFNLGEILMSKLLG